MKDFLEKLKQYYHLSEEEYEELIKPSTLSSFSDGYQFEDIEKARDIALEAIKNHQRIIIYGDYDADGILGTSILVKMFQYLNKEVSYYIPSRYIDGYGLNVENALKIKEKFDLIITVDNGIVANEAIDILKNANKKVIVIDHHMVQLPLPRADAIIHYELSKYGDIPTSGAYTAFMFSKSLLGYDDKYLAILAAISLISDMMPLRKYNRNLLKAVIKEYKDNEFLPLSLLADHKKFDENLIGSVIAPRINAIGRMVEDKNINLIVKYFTKDDDEFVLTYYNYILETNERRKEISKRASEEILTNLDDSALVSVVDIKEGLIGLIAASIMNKLHKPAIVFSKNKDGILKGSARSIEGFNIVEAFQKLDQYLLMYGGHALAGGCSLKEENYEAFKKDFISLINKEEIVVPEKENIEISLNDINYDNYQIYLSFSPFGEGWKAPELLIKHIRPASLSFSKTGEHILTPIGTNSKLVGFYMSKDSLSLMNSVSIYGSLASSIYRNNVTTEFHIKRLKEEI